MQIILPAVQHIPGDDLNGSFENVLDALFQTAYSPVIIATSILMILSIAFFNYFSLQITRYFSGIYIFYAVDMPLLCGIKFKPRD